MTRVRQGDRLLLVVVSSIGAIVKASARVVLRDGSERELRVPETTLTGAAGVPASQEPESGNSPSSGEVADATVSVRAAVTVSRGQVYATLYLTDGSERKNTLCKGYVYDGHDLAEGQFVEPGPGGGEGFLSWVEVFHNRAGNAAAVEYNLFVTGLLRKILGLAWYYHCDNTVATRTFVEPLINGLGGPKPTGFTLTGTNATYWFPGGDITLTQDQEGAFIAQSLTGKDGRSVRITNGSVATIDVAATPIAFPIMVTENDTDTIARFRAITNGVATDRHSAYLLIEEWLVP